MEEAKNNIKNFFKDFFKKRKKSLIIAIILAVTIVLLARATYYITVEDGTYKEDDWSSTPYGAGEYIKNIEVNHDGTIKSNTSAKELWDKLEEGKSSVGDYLKNPEELARLMKAEMVTQYPDLRPDPDQPIDWEEIIKDPDKIQGIIKFKRAKSNGQTETMSYVDKETLYEWIELYTETGEEKYKDLALTHFTLAENDGSADLDGSNDWTSEEALKYNASDIMTDKSDAIVKAAKTTGSPGSGLCQKWVRLVYNKAGLGNKSFLTAYKAFKANCVSRRKDNIPIGAAVYGTGSGSAAGHVGIYIGNGKVMDNVGTIKTQSLESWIAWQERRKTCIPGVKSGWLGWGWQAGHPKIISSGNSTEDMTDNDMDDIEDDTEDEDMEDAEDATDEEQKEEDTINYSVVVATWEQIDTTVTSNDPGVEEQNTTQYEMTTTNINYGEMVESYTMPFDLLWALLVVGEDKNFIFELTDLIYNSDIQITVHDNLTVNTDIDEWHYTEETKAEVDATIKANCNGKTATATLSDDIHDPYESIPYQTTKKVVTKTNTLDIALTKANVWIVDYENKYTYDAARTNTTPSEVEEEDEAYPNQPSSTGDSFSCDHIEEKKAELRNQVQTAVLQDPEGMPTVDGTPIGVIEATVHFEEDIKVKYYKRHVDIYDKVTNIETTQSYVPGTPDIKEKTDDKTAPNFVTIFKKFDYRANKSKIKDASKWLFEIIETNESTADKLDLIKYLLYKATGHNYGVTEYDFSEFEPQTFSNVEGIYGNTVEEKVWFSLRAAGYSEIATAAVMGNIESESEFDTDKIEASTGAGYGLCQWTGDRRTAFEKYARSKGEKPSNVDVQIEFLIAELKPGGGANGHASCEVNGPSSNRYDGTSYKRSDWEKATNLDRATTAFMALFERPAYDEGTNHLPRRKKSAKRYYDMFHGKEAPMGSGGGGSSLQVAKGTSAQKLKFLFPGGTPKTESGLKKYMATVDMPLTTKNGKKTTGKLTIHKQLVADVQDVFRTAQAGGFKIYEAAGFAFRYMNNGGSGNLSHHSYGVAIDINVRENYSHRGSTVYAGSFWNPSKSPYSIPRNGVLVKAFKAKGWKWGGNWSGNYQDYMHFSFTGH